MFGAAKRGIQATTEMNTLESNRDTHPIAAAEPKQAPPSETPVRRRRWQRVEPKASTVEPPQAHSDHSVTQIPILQCATCEHHFCDGTNLAFFRMVNEQKATEIYLMLKPERLHPNILQTVNIESSATGVELGYPCIDLWFCQCGAELGDTRKVAGDHTPMTAFKKEAVLLGGQRIAGQNWSSVYNMSPFDQIEVREHDTYLGSGVQRRCTRSEPHPTDGEQPETEDPPLRKAPPPLLKAPPPLLKAPPPLPKAAPPLRKAPPPSLRKAPPPLLKAAPPLLKAAPPLRKTPPPSLPMTLHHDQTDRAAPPTIKAAPQMLLAMFNAASPAVSGGGALESQGQPLARLPVAGGISGGIVETEVESQNQPAVHRIDGGGERHWSTWSGCHWCYRTPPHCRCRCRHCDVPPQRCRCPPPFASVHLNIASVKKAPPPLTEFNANFKAPPKAPASQ
jgi:hypothetical protein